MTPLELARRYMRIVFEGGDPRQLESVLAETCQFKGPFFESQTASAYIDSLIQSPPLSFSHETIAEFETNSSACIVFEFSKPGVATTMAQLFDVRNGKITRILLVFDGRAFD